MLSEVLVEESTLLAVCIAVFSGNDGEVGAAVVHVWILLQLLAVHVAADDVHPHHVADLGELLPGVRAEGFFSDGRTDVHDAAERPVPGNDIFIVPFEPEGVFVGVAELEVHFLDGSGIQGVEWVLGRVLSLVAS